MQKANTSNVSHIEQVVLPDNAELIKLGVNAEEFSASNIGRFLLGKAMTEAVAATNDIRSLNPEQANFKSEYNRLQMIINRHLDLEKWVKEAINIGRQAYEQYEQDFIEGEQ